MNPEAKELNAILKSEGASAFRLLSERGRRIFFPRKGLVAQGLDAKGKAINASIGEAKEDDGSPLRLGFLADRIELDPDDVFSYASSFGKPELRDIWARMIYEKNPSLGKAPFSRPVVTNALTHGMSAAGYLFVDKGDEVIIPHLYWGNYRLIFSEAYGAVLKTFNTFNKEGPEAGFDIPSLRKSLLDEGEKKILLLNFPNNPTGYCPTLEEYEGIISVVLEAAEAGKTILALTDDAYFGLVFRKGIAKESLFARLATLHENIVACKVDGATKEDYVWGFRVGFITFAGKNLGDGARRALEDKAAGYVRGSISNDSHLSQSLLLASYNDHRYASEKERAFLLLKQRHDVVAKELEDHPEYRTRFEALPFNSGYFMCLRLKVADANAEAVRQHLLKEYDTGVVALGDLIRVAYSSLEKSCIPKLFANLYGACGDLMEG